MRTSRPNLSRSINALLSELPSNVPLTAAQLVTELVRRHPDYGGGLAAQLTLEGDDRRLEANEWIASARNRLELDEVDLLDTRALILGLATIDEKVGHQLTSVGYLQQLRDEFNRHGDEREPRSADNGRTGSPRVWLLGFDAYDHKRPQTLESLDWRVPLVMGVGDFGIVWLDDGAGLSEVVRIKSIQREGEVGIAKISHLASIRPQLNSEELGTNRILATWDVFERTRPRALMAQTTDITSDAAVWRALWEKISRNAPDAATLLPAPGPSTSSSLPEVEAWQSTADSDAAIWNDLRLTDEAQRLLDFAAVVNFSFERESRWLTSRTILLAFIEGARSALISEFTPQFVWRAVRAGPGGTEQYDSKRRELFGERAERVFSMTANPVPPAVTPNIANIFKAAANIASATTGQSLIAPRHLFAALVSYQGGGGEETGAIGFLNELGVDVPTLRTDFCDAVREEFPDDGTDAWKVQLLAALGDAQNRLEAVYNSDDAKGVDRLNITRDVRAFAAVIASPRLVPPMSVGLFGEWGSGKSFFMNHLYDEVKKLSKKNAKGGTNGIVQIQFNAWHYLDTDLWASLVSEIFNHLFDRVGGDPDKPEAKLPELRQSLKEANGVYQQAKQELDDAEGARKRAAEALTAVVNAREDREGTIRTALNDVATLVVGRADVKAEVNKLADDLGMPSLQHSFAALDERAREAKSSAGRMQLLWQSVVTAPWGGRRLFWLLVACAAPVAITVGVTVLRARTGASIATISELTAQASAFLIGVTAWLKTQITRGNAVLNELEDVHGKLETIRKSRREAFEKDDATALRELSEKEDAARKALLQADLTVQTLKREIEELQPARLITRFIEERTKSSDYRSRLGVVSLVRRDFERLSELATAKDRKAMPVERIVLYIDDLDRCKPKRVIEVLEAIHLLLAFRLFVVVVGVDARWVSHALTTEYQNLLVSPMNNANGSTPTASPLDYLEKIFQVPFWLRPMSETDSEEMILGLLAPPDKSTDEESSSENESATKNVIGEALSDTEEKEPVPAVVDAVRDKQEPKVVVREDHGTNVGGDAGAPAEDPSAELVTIDKTEIAFIRGLASFIGNSPRRMKRFVNTYQLIKAGVPPGRRAFFLEKESSSGEYQAVLVLLAIVTNAPTLSDRAFQVIAQMDGSSTLKLLGEKLTSDFDSVPSPEARIIVGAIRYYQETRGMDASIGDLKRWVKQVARYSFRAQRL